MRSILGSMRRAWRRGRPAPLVLMYHRVASPEADPWDLAVSPDNFDAHMEILARRRTPLPMGEFARRLAQGDLPADAVAVTFDDGYVDNLRNAKPRLERHGVPATVFLATDRIGCGEEFWWDELARLILCSRSASRGDFEIGGVSIAWNLPAGEASREEAWRAWEDAATPRQLAFMDIWAKLRRLEEEDRVAAMDRIRRELAAGPPPPEDLPMTVDEVTRLLEGGLVEIGGHTLTHPTLPSLTREEQRREISAGKSACEALAGRPIHGFAYPYGDYDEVARAEVEASGFKWACTTRSEAIRRPVEDLFLIPRVQALDWDGAGFERAIAEA